MHLILNALSVTNSSGRHVFLGHLRELARSLQGSGRFTVLYHPENRDMVEDLGSHVVWEECPAGTHRWGQRSVWERFRLPHRIRSLGGDAVFSPAGISTAGLSVPQIVFCQNPWCLVCDVHRGIGERVKAALQRFAYKAAVNRADVMVFNSAFMRDAYTTNAGRRPGKSIIAYQGIDESTFAAAEALRGKVEQNPRQILTVSVMGAHKGLEIICDALVELKARKVDFVWNIIGSWPDEAYKEAIVKKIEDNGLRDLVRIEGHVSRDALHRAYAESRVFCLMSRCESFGIPAVEAQAFGTPVVTSQGCAMPEIDGGGGLYPARGDAGATADALEQILVDDTLAQTLHQRAIENASRFHWRDCSLPLIECLRDLSTS